MKLFVRAFLCSWMTYSYETLAEPMEVPDFNLKSLIGTPLQRGDLNGKVSLVYFWASWCGPCQRQLPALDKFFLDHSAKGLLVLGVNEDPEVKTAQAFLQSSTTPHFPVLIDSEHKLAADINLRALPTLVLITPDGEIGGLVQGPDVAAQAALLEKARALLTARPR